MSAYQATRIDKERFKLAPLRSGRSQKRRTVVLGFDSEADTRDGSPMLVQVSYPRYLYDQYASLRQNPWYDDERDTLLYVIPEDDAVFGALRFLMRFIDAYLTRKDCEYLIYGWNIAYEYTQLFRHLSEEARNQDEIHASYTVAVEGNKYDITAYNNKRYFAKIVHVATKRQIRLLDGMSFYKTGLDNAAKMLGVGQKYDAEGLSREHFTRDDLTNETFLRYARTDAWVTRRIGEQIIDLHKRYDVSTCISAPHFASKVFKRHYLRSEIGKLDHDLEQIGLYSYHGGKNGFYLDGPTQLENVYQYDITSAYPEAMRQMPNVETARWVETRKHEPNKHGVYHVTLDYRRCRFRGMMDYDGTWPESGIVDTYLTSYELDAMMERGECDVLRLHGYNMVGDSGGPLVSYVDEFFGMKATTTGPERETAKLFLNSLYGKFFQKTPLGRVGWLFIDLDDMTQTRWIETDPLQPYDWKAGGLYHPPIASLITGFVRAKIHRLEHKYDALMTSTDGIFGLAEPDPLDIGTTLGTLTVSHGSLKIWRERLYIFRPYDGSKQKVALHGWQSSWQVLDGIPLKRDTYHYTGKKLVTLKLSTRGIGGERYMPGRFVERNFVLTI